MTTMMTVALLILWSIIGAWLPEAVNSSHCSCEQKPKLLMSVSGSSPVFGVQPIGNEIYVLRHTSQHVEVYDRNTFKPTRNLTINGLKEPWDMVQSSLFPNTLFISDWPTSRTDSQIYFYSVEDVSQSGIATSTYLGTTQSGPALSGSDVFGTILLSLDSERKVLNLSPSGHVFETLVFPREIRPRHTIQLESNLYAVAHGLKGLPFKHRVCLVKKSDNSGDQVEVLKCHGNDRGSGPSSLDSPYRLELYKDDCILVTDNGNNRVVLLTRELEYVEDLITDIDNPWRLYFDKDNELLYVASGQRFEVYDVRC